MDWLMSQYEKLISSQKDYLPQKAKKGNYSQMIWVEAPEHNHFPNNLLRFKFNRALQTAASFHSNVHVLELKKGCNSKDRSLYLKEEQRFTAEGLNRYWEVVDKTVQFADTILFKKLEKS